MPAPTTNQITRYTDRDAAARGDPGISHSYVASVATALNHLYGDLDPVWLMGSSAFAFRILVSQILCPSAMSVFERNASAWILPVSRTTTRATTTGLAATLESF